MVPRSVTPERRASETVTIRLTKRQKALLDRLASLGGTTSTEVIRAHIAERAAALGLEVEGPAAIPVPAASSAGRTAAFSLPPPPEVPAASQAATLAGLIARFRGTFGDRGEGTRRELEEALRFFTEPEGDGPAPILPSEVPVGALTPERLAAVRERVRVAPTRLSRKNLYLTYLRMLLHFGFKRGEISIDASPGAELRPITAVEVDEPWGAAGR